jgi:hypothetical protein
MRASEALTKADHDAVPIELTAVIVAVTGEQPRVLTIQDSEALPAGPFESGHRTLQIGLRSWVERQTHHPLGYVEQLYTFADRDRTHDGAGERLVSISYLGLTREAHASGERDPRWQTWYRFLPWEDWRSDVAAAGQHLSHVSRREVRALDATTGRATNECCQPTPP